MRIHLRNGYFLKGLQSGIWIIRSPREEPTLQADSLKHAHEIVNALPHGGATQDDALAEAIKFKTELRQAFLRR